MRKFKPVWVNLVVAAVTLVAVSAHAEGPQDLAREATVTVRPHVDRDPHARFAGQLGVGLAGVAAANDRGAELYLDTALGFVAPSKWGVRLGMRLAPGVGSWLDFHGAATYDSRVGRTALQVGVAGFAPFYLCLNFNLWGGASVCPPPPSYAGPMLGLQHEFQLLGPFGVQTGLRLALMHGQTYAMFNFGIGVSL